MNWREDILSFTENNEITGLEYEELCAKYLRNIGYSSIETTKKSGDQGVDIIAYKNGYKYAIQCKYYSAPVGNSAIQEVVAGASFYDCNKKMVITNNSFTPSARELAECNDVSLMPGITSEVIHSSLSFRRMNVGELYSEYKHSLPSKESLFGYVSHDDLERQYRAKICEAEKSYKYLRNKNLDKYKPTNSYNPSSLNFLFGINHRLNKTLEDYVLALLKAFRDDGLHDVESTRIHTEDNGLFILYFKNTSIVPLDPIKLKIIQAHLHSAGFQCAYDIEMIDENSFKLIISERGHTSAIEAYQQYEELKNKYNQGLIKEDKIIHYTDGYLSKKWFSSLEESVFENVGYFLLTHQSILPTNYILNPIQLFDVEYNSSTGFVTFIYYCGVDFRFFKDPRCKQYRKDIEIEDDTKCVLQISADVLLNEYFILKDEIFFNESLSPSRMQAKLTDLRTIQRDHPLTPTENITFIHSRDFICESAFE